MFGKKTIAGVKDGHLAIMTKDARHPGVISLSLDQVKGGQFETAPADNGGSVLVFKPSGRKTADTIAVYDSADKAAKALQNVYKALSGAGKSGKGNFFLSVLKVVGVTVLVIVVIVILISTLFGIFFGDAAKDQVATAEMLAPAETSGAVTTTQQQLPVGEAFPAIQYIEATQDAGLGEPPAAQ